MTSFISVSNRGELLAEVIDAINDYTKMKVARNTTQDEAKKIKLRDDLGIGPNMAAQLSVALTKISLRYGGQGVGAKSAQDAKTVYDCYALVYASISGENP